MSRGHLWGMRVLRDLFQIEGPHLSRFAWAHEMAFIPEEASVTIESLLEMRVVLEQLLICADGVLLSGIVTEDMPEDMPKDPTMYLRRCLSGRLLEAAQGIELGADFLALIEAYPFMFEVHQTRLDGEERVRNVEDQGNNGFITGI